MILLNSENVINPPLTLQVLYIVSKAIEHLPDADAKRSASNTVINIAKEIQNPLLQSSVGLFNCQRNAIHQHMYSKPEDAAKMSEELIMYLKKAIEKCKRSKDNPNIHEPAPVTLASHHEALANCSQREFSLHSMHLILGLNCLETNTQARLAVTIHSGSYNIN